MSSSCSFQVLVVFKILVVYVLVVVFASFALKLYSLHCLSSMPPATMSTASAHRHCCSSSPPSFRLSLYLD
ncbi:hypothetical protein TorRG33x02_077180 [Trema orientale]|uniref:Transmembrane protein n=1 Tax=Trema orientale TaxID=63057 RepID=A0A2P5FF72_TREOI|nr:hypothetical protein TorRG33x02_077180 [Trema orientale]